MKKSSTATIDTEIAWKRLSLVVEEAAWAIKATSFSPLVTEGNDFSCLLYDSAGRLITQNSQIAAKIGSWHSTVQAIIQIYGDDIHDGDAFLTNDPWIGDGHLYDCSVLRPIFYEGQLVAFADCTAHISDIGGTQSNQCRELQEEGLVLPPVRIVTSRGEQADMFRLLEANVRRPRQSLGDIRGLIAGTQSCEDGLKKFIERNAGDADAFMSIVDELIERTEQAVRAAIAERLPAGRFEYEITVDGYQQPITVRAAIQRDELANVTVDFSGSSDQQPIGVNSPMTVTYPWAAFAIKAALCADVPNNAGFFAAIKVTAPEGSIVNPRHGAPVRMRAVASHIIASVVLGALCESGAVEGIAEAGAPVWLLRFSGVRTSGEPIAETLIFNGGTGARATSDGLSAVSFPSNSANLPVEMIERSLPVRVLTRQLVPGSGGRGMHVGGRGQRFAFRVLAQQRLSVLVQAARREIPAKGMAGGGSGAVGHVLINGSDADRRGEFDLEEGTTMELVLPGGGGFGERAHM
jgi:N-methylhydantoinase B